MLLGDLDDAASEIELNLDDLDFDTSAPEPVEAPEVNQLIDDPRSKPQAAGGVPVERHDPEPDDDWDVPDQPHKDPTDPHNLDIAQPRVEPTASDDDDSDLWSMEAPEAVEPTSAPGEPQPDNDSEWDFGDAPDKAPEEAVKSSWDF